MTVASDSEVQKTVKIPQVQYTDKIVDIPCVATPSTSHPNRKEDGECSSESVSGSSGRVFVVMQRQSSPVVEIVAETKAQQKQQCSSDTLQRERDSSPFVAASTGTLHSKLQEVAQDTLERE